MFQLVTFPPAFGLRNVSPFCLKIEMLLTALEIPFKQTQLSDPRKAPKGKLPFLIADDGERIPDSELITEYLDHLTHGRVYAGLTPAQKAEGVALSRLADDHLYWLMVASRWLNDAWWPTVVEGFFSFMPPVVKQIGAAAARSQIRKGYNFHGLGRHSLEEQQGFACRDLEALDTLSQRGQFLFGDKPCVYDFTIASLMAGIYDNKPPTWLTEIARDYINLHAYTERVQKTVGVYGRAQPSGDT